MGESIVRNGGPKDSGEGRNPSTAKAENVFFTQRDTLGKGNLFLESLEILGKREMAQKRNCLRCNKLFEPVWTEAFCSNFCQKKGVNKRIRDMERGLSAEEKKKLRSERRVKNYGKKLYRMISDKFLRSQEWRSLRFKALERYGRKCLGCGRSAPDVVIHVDHIKPRVKYPDLALDIENLQILCEDCNKGKGSRSQADFR